MAFWFLVVKALLLFLVYKALQEPNTCGFYRMSAVNNKLSHEYIELAMNTSYDQLPIYRKATQSSLVPASKYTASDQKLEPGKARERG